MGSCLSRGTKSQSLSQTEMHLPKAGKSQSLSQAEMCLMKAELARMEPHLVAHIFHIQETKADDASAADVAHLCSATCIIGGKLFVLSEQHIDHKVRLKVRKYLEDVSELMSSKREGEQIDFKELKIIPK
jgi:hypothetical protein